MFKEMIKKKKIHIVKGPSLLHVKKPSFLNSNSSSIIAGRQNIRSGPGAYNIRESFVKKSYNNNEKGLGFFSSSHRFLDSNSIIQAKEASESSLQTYKKITKPPSLNPDKYITTRSIAQPSLKSYKNQKFNHPTLKPSDPTESFERNDSLEEEKYIHRSKSPQIRAPFSSTEERFPLVSNELPGPTTYKINRELNKPTGVVSYDKEIKNFRQMEAFVKNYPLKVLEDIVVTKNEERIRDRQESITSRLRKTQKQIPTFGLSSHTAESNSRQRKVSQQGTLVSLHDRERQPVPKKQRPRPVVSFLSKVAS